MMSTGFRRAMALSTASMAAARYLTMSSTDVHAEEGYTLKPLPYERSALAKLGISEETVNFHYGKHHQGYVTKLNALRKGQPHVPLIELVDGEKGAVFNCAAQILNHDFYWASLSPEPTTPGPELTKALTEQWGSVEKFKEAFTAEAMSHFGSGWTWLVYRPDIFKLAIMSTHDAECVRTSGQIPLLVCDVWEHAYYIDFRNNRGAYLDTFWSAVNWSRVDKLNANGVNLSNEEIWGC